MDLETPHTERWREHAREGRVSFGKRRFRRRMDGMTRACAGLAALLLAAAVGASAQAAETASIHLRGSTSLLTAAQKVAEAYMARNPDTAVVVRGGDSGPGLKALLDGTADVAMVSAAIPPDVIKRAKALSLALSVRMVALDAVVPVVNPANPLASLSLDQLRALYRGAIDDWSTLAGGTGGVTLLALPPVSGTAVAWKAAVLGDGVQTPRAQAVNAAQMKKTLAADPGAIGYLGLAAVDASIKPVAIDGVPGTRQTVQDGSYPLRRELSLVTTDKSGKAVADFVAFFTSPEAQTLVAGSGLLPLAGKE